MQAFTLQQIKAPLTRVDREFLEPGDGEVVVRLRAASLNRRDYWITQGMYPGIQCPVVLGSDGAGIVTKTGSALGNYWQGREVTINPGWNWGKDNRVQSSEFQILGMPRDGTFAEEIVVPAEYLHLKPAHLDWIQTAALPLAASTAYRAVFTQGNLQPNDQVLINGIGGGVATFALLFATAVGAKCWVTSSSDQKIEQAIALGAAGGVNYKADDWGKQLAKSTAPTLIIDSAGGKNYNTLLSIAAPGGTIINYGSTSGMPDKLDLFKLFWKQLVVRGSTMASPSDFEAMLALVNQHQITPVIDQVFPLQDSNAALQRMATSTQFGKLVLQIDP